MEYKDIIEKIKPEMDKAIGFLEREIAKIRANRAAPSLIEDIMVDCFGQKLPLKQMGTITPGGPRQLIIQPWDASYLEAIEKALSQSNLGASVSKEGEVIRVSLPPLSEEFRESLLKVLSEKMEQGRRTVRRWREQAWKEVQEKQRTGEIREDDKYRAKDDLQKLVDEHNKKIDEMGETKKKEITD